MSLVIHEDKICDSCPLHEIESKVSIQRMDETQVDQITRRTIQVYDVEDMHTGNPFKLISFGLFAFIIVLIIIIVLKSIF